MKYYIILFFALLCGVAEGQVNVSHQRPFPQSIEVIDNDFDSVFVLNPTEVVEVSNLDEIIIPPFVDLDDTDNDVIILESRICADGGEALAVSRYSSIGAFFSTEYKRFDGTIFTPVNFDCADVVSTFINEVCYLSTAGEILQGSQKIDITGGVPSVSLLDDAGAVVAGTITPCIVDSEFCSYAGESATILYDEAGGFWVRTLANPTVLVAGDWVSLDCTPTGGGTGSVSAVKKTVGVSWAEAKQSTNTTLSSKNATITRTAVGRYTVLFGTPHPSGTGDYVVLVSNEEQGNLRDGINTQVVQGTATATGFDIMTTTGDNGGNADAYVDTPFSFSVTSEEEVVTDIVGGTTPPPYVPFLYDIDLSGTAGDLSGANWQTANLEGDFDGLNAAEDFFYFSGSGASGSPNGGANILPQLLTDVMDISAAASVDVLVEYSSYFVTGNGMESSDEIFIHYNLDGAGWVLIDNKNALQFPQQTTQAASVNGLTGNTLQIRVAVRISADDEFFRIENINITE